MPHLRVDVGVAAQYVLGRVAIAPGGAVLYSRLPCVVQFLLMRSRLAKDCAIAADEGALALSTVCLIELFNDRAYSNDSTVFIMSTVVCYITFR